MSIKTRKKMIPEFRITGFYEGDLIFAVRSRSRDHINVVSQHFSAVHFLADLGAVVYDSRNEKHPSLPQFLYCPEDYDLLCLGRIDRKGRFFPFIHNPILDFEDFVNYFKRDDDPHLLDWMSLRGYLENKSSTELAEELGLVNKKKEK